MPSVQPGDHPLIDLILYSRHPFPSDIEKLLLKLYRISPFFVCEESISYTDYVDWRGGRNLDAGRQKLIETLSHFGSDTDRIMDEGFAHLQSVLARLKLTEDEKKLASDAAAQLFQHSFDFLTSYPGLIDLRPVVIALALAQWLGPSGVWERTMNSVL